MEIYTKNFNPYQNKDFFKKDHNSNQIISEGKVRSLTSGGLGYFLKKIWTLYLKFFQLEVLFKLYVNELVFNDTIFLRAVSFKLLGDSIIISHDFKCTYKVWRFKFVLITIYNI